MKEDPWANFARLQAKADSPVLNDTYWATDDALASLLDQIAAKRPPLTEQQISDLIGNKRRKHRRRRRAIETTYSELAKDVHRVRVDPQHSEAQGTSRIDAVKALTPLSPRERQIVLKLAIGHTLDEIATSLQKPIGSVKTWSYRARQKMAA